LDADLLALNRARAAICVFKSTNLASWRNTLLDQRTQKARRTRYKLIVREIAKAGALAAE
jgi:hypothetical protein